MSFGWSAGDIWAAIQLLNRIISSVNNIGGSRDNFQELQTELEGLRRALHEISQLASQPGQIPEIVALKFAACLCEDTLKRFFEKIKPFDEALGLGTKVPKLRVAPRMVRWELLVKKDIPEFRCYLVAHVGSLNLRLNTALLKAASTAASRSSQSHIQQLQATELVNEKVTTQSSTIYSKIELISKEETVPRLEQLLGVAGNVWKSQRDLLDMFGKALETLPPPDLRYTWAQAPVKFEDALGRILPVPSEYDWDKLEAIIHAQFKKGPGYDKVRSNEYELYTGTDTMVVDVAPIKFSLFCPFPGMSIKMAFIIGQYAGSERCPRVGCLSKSFSKVGRGQRGRLCAVCGCWIRISNAELPKPLKPPFDSRHSAPDDRAILESPNSKEYSSFKQRGAYRNISVYITKLPATPTRFREKHHRNSWRQVAPPPEIKQGPKRGKFGTAARKPSSRALHSTVSVYREEVKPSRCLQSNTSIFDSLPRQAVTPKRNATNLDSDKHTS